MPRALSTLASILLLAGASQAQNGLRFAPVEYDHVMNYQDPTPVYFVFGYDRDLGQGLSSGVELALQWTWIFGFEPQTPYDLQYGDWSVNVYDKSYRTFTVTYHSSFFPWDNDAGFYLGASVGMRRISSSILLAEPWYSGIEDPPSPFKSRYEGTLTMFPVGLRLGVRSPMDVIYQDLYLGLGYQLGSNGTLYPQPELAGRYQQPAGFTISLGYAFGFGL